ncbi:MAG: phytoene/squalene synthase family protein [Cyclobacteriaceae bacterium]|nr:phytoene/squalene synthase family protein [Cyclobacteriaceae bacterium]
MVSMNLFDHTTYLCSKTVTINYSTSFSLGIKVLSKSYHNPTYAIYGFVRYADEIVDTFHNHDKEWLLSEFKLETYKAINKKISLNPILHSFQDVVNTYNIGLDLVEAFFRSMEMDLGKIKYDDEKYNEYIYGSAEVVGLMCLCVFCAGDTIKYKELEAPARRLGAAFQKVNFLRDMQSDFAERGRVYFPGINIELFDDTAKKEIERDIESDFDAALVGIKKLPKGARVGVYLAYVYYLKLFAKIRSCPVSTILSQRIRIPDFVKIVLLIRTYFRFLISKNHLETT